MAKFIVKTKGNGSPKGKPRVYFSCHPADFERYFEKICADLWTARDCAVYYTEDMTEDFLAEDLETELHRMNLLVVPVTFKLLRERNRTLDFDLAYAKKEHIPVLPIMMETGLDALYSLPEKFGKLQYLNPFSTDFTEIGYEEKLKKYLDAVLVDDDTAERIRKAFDAYVFLSYRKKDRRYANDLMRLIHKHPECRDIAIWYDEFLTPGESFEENIGKALERSDLFALLVTPNLLEEVDGKPNFVMGVEYPEAKKAGKPIFPAEMEETDKQALQSKFEGIPTCTDPQNEPLFKDAFLKALCRAAKSENDADPEHNFLIGLAYLEGIDVEVDRERALALITSAAEGELPEAMEKLYKMYDEGYGVPLDYRKAAYFAEKLASYYQKTKGEEHPDTLTALSNLAHFYGKAGEGKRALALKEQVYAQYCRVFGSDHPDTLVALSNLAAGYGAQGDLQKEKELGQRVYDLRKGILGEGHPDTLNSLLNLSVIYGDLGMPKESLELRRRAYAMHERILGGDHPRTLIALSNLASALGTAGDHKQALTLHLQAYDLRLRVLGKEHPQTVNTLNNLAATHRNLGELEKAAELFEEVVSARMSSFGEGHPDTLVALSNLAFVYGDLGDHLQAKALFERVLALRLSLFGREHPQTLNVMHNLALTERCLKNHQRAKELLEQVYLQRSRILGRAHPQTLTAQGNLACLWGDLGNYQRERVLEEEVYALRCETLGKEHPQTLSVLSNLAYTCAAQKDYCRAIALQRELCALREKTLGGDHRKTRQARAFLEKLKNHLS